MTIIEEQAQALTLALLDAGREEFWTLLLVSWYLGKPGREVALRVIEERGIEQIAGSPPRNVGNGYAALRSGESAT